MDKAHFIRLLQKFLQGNATKAEKEFLMSYYELFNAEPEVNELLSQQQKEEIKNQIKDSIWQSIHKFEQQNQKERTYAPVWIRMMPAAALILGICLTAVFFLLSNKTQDPPRNVSQTIQQKEHQLIHLPDGSFVIIKAGSKLHYPSTFDGSDTREVHLEGQAYFDVKHNPSKPFIVHAGNLKTTVLGTSFNIKAWPTEVDVSITVTKGKVKVEDQHKIFGTVVKDQQLTFSKEKAEVIQTEVDASSSLAWKEQDLLLDDVTILEAAELLEDRFDVKITCVPEVIRPDRFTLTIPQGESLEHVLISICEFNNAVYQLDKKNAAVIIRSKR